MSLHTACEQGRPQAQRGGTTPSLTTVTGLTPVTQLMGSSEDPESLTSWSETRTAQRQKRAGPCARRPLPAHAPPL